MKYHPLTAAMLSAIKVRCACSEEPIKLCNQLEGRLAAEKAKLNAVLTDANNEGSLPYWQRKTTEAMAESVEAVTKLESLEVSIADLSHPNMRMLLAERDALKAERDKWYENHKTDCLRLSAERDEFESLHRANGDLIAEKNKKIDQLRADKSASQQEVQRLREAIDMVTGGLTELETHCAAQNGITMRIGAGIWKALVSALSSTPAPVHPDTERLARLEWLMSKIDYCKGEDGMAWATLSWCVEAWSLAPATLEDAIDAELARTKGAK